MEKSVEGRRCTEQAAGEKKGKVPTVAWYRGVWGTCTVPTATSNWRPAVSRAKVGRMEHSTREE